MVLQLMSKGWRTDPSEGTMLHERPSGLMEAEVLVGGETGASVDPTAAAVVVAAAPSVEGVGLTTDDDDDDVLMVYVVNIGIFIP